MISLRHKLIPLSPTLTASRIPQFFMKDDHYNRDWVSFVPVDMFDMEASYNEGYTKINYEHPYTSPLFMEAAAENTLEAWERRHISPIPVYHIDCVSTENPQLIRRWFYRIYDGQHRLNSALEIQRANKIKTSVPVVDLTDFFNICVQTKLASATSISGALLQQLQAYGQKYTPQQPEEACYFSL